MMKTIRKNRKLDIQKEQDRLAYNIQYLLDRIPSKNKQGETKIDIQQNITSNVLREEEKKTRFLFFFPHILIFWGGILAKNWAIMPI